MTPAGETRLKLDEGCVLWVYDDKSGHPVLQGPAGGVPTVGYGRNLRDAGISQAEADFLFTNDVAVCEADLLLDFPWMKPWLVPPSVTGDVLVMVQFNTGRIEDFVKMLAALEAGNLSQTIAELLDSDAARELPARYNRMAAALLKDAWA